MGNTRWKELCDANNAEREEPALWYAIARAQVSHSPLECATRFFKNHPSRHIAGESMETKIAASICGDLPCVLVDYLKRKRDKCPCDRKLWIDADRAQRNASDKPSEETRGPIQV
jgi:hypothetical protein